MSDIAIRVENLSKQYRIGGPQVRYKTIRESLTQAARAPFHRLSAVVRGQSPVVSNETIWALRNVSFDVKRGEVVGVIGRNGAGKTTLLKILSRITDPTEGRVRLRGRVGSLLEVGTGFHPELTGRENIYLNGAIIGMKRAEIENRFDEIVAFAEIEKFIDTPVKHYSSGMYVRLAFAVAAHLEPEILLVDEVLAVGDAAFQKKCLGKMEEVASQGRTVLFVSHNLGAVQELCQRCVWIEQGIAKVDGGVGHVISSYLSNTSRNMKSFYKRQQTDHQLDHGEARLLEAELIGAEGLPSRSLRFREPFSIRLVWKYSSGIPGIAYAVKFYDSVGRLLSAANTSHTHLHLADAGTHRVVCRFDHNVFVPGEYYISVGSYVRPNTTVHVVDPCLKLVVLNVPYLENPRFNIMGKPVFAMYPQWEEV